MSIPYGLTHLDPNIESAFTEVMVHLNHFEYNINVLKQRTSMMASLSYTPVD